MRLSTSVVVALMETLLGRIDSPVLSEVAQLLIYEGAIPPDTTNPAGTVLLTIPLKNPSFLPKTNNATVLEYELDYPPLLASSTTGTASYFRLVTSAGVVVLQGSVSDQNGSGDLTISTTSIRPNLLIRVVDFLIKIPKE